MNRQELLNNAKPILFNTEMVRAILDGRKTVTRRVIKLKYDNTHIKIRNNKYGKSVIEIQNDVEGETHGTNPDGTHWQKLLGCIEKYPPYKVGDILYVRETWCQCPCWDCGMDTSEGCCDETAHKFYNIKRKEWGCYGYKASWELNSPPFDRWYPSIHMPKEAARIFLRVTDLRVKRLQDMWASDMSREGICFTKPTTVDEMIEAFETLWDSTIKKTNLDRYGWKANPWVWVIEFERIEAE